VRRVAERGAALLLLPLSVVPFLLLGPQIAQSHRNYVREHSAAPLPLPPVAVSAAEAARWRPLAPRSGGRPRVPVLAYPAVGVTRPELARQMEMLARADVRPISIHQYSRFSRGLPAGLPPRPVLISFYGGRLATFRAADRVLQHYGFRATMFAQAGAVARRDRDYLSWRELHAMARSGRWDVQAAPYAIQPRVTRDASGRQGEPYAYRRYTRSAGLETVPEWQARVGRDVFDARTAMIEQGFDPVAFELPYARVAPWARALVTSQFGVLFAGPAPDRFVVTGRTDADRLYRWLAR
jgi:hypothetical protein